MRTEDRGLSKWLPGYGAQGHPSRFLNPQSSVLNPQSSLSSHGTTITLTVPVLPSDVAVIATNWLLAATPVTKPLLLTRAISVSALAHVIGRPVSTELFAARSVAVS